jgi:hypothetical protein
VGRVTYSDVDRTIRFPLALYSQYAAESAAAFGDEHTQQSDVVLLGQSTQLDPANAQITESGLQANSSAPRVSSTACAPLCAARPASSRVAGG